MILIYDRYIVIPDLGYIVILDHGYIVIPDYGYIVIPDQEYIVIFDHGYIVILDQEYIVIPDHGYIVIPDHVYIVIPNQEYIVMRIISSSESGFPFILVSILWNRSENKIIRGKNKLICYSILVIQSTSHMWVGVIFLCTVPELFFFCKINLLYGFWRNNKTKCGKSKTF